MKILKVNTNNRKKAFEITTSKQVFEFPYRFIKYQSELKNPQTHVIIDLELGSEAFTIQYSSGQSESVHLDQIMEYNRDPDYLRRALLYQLSLQAQKLIAAKGYKKREIIRRLKTSPTQFYRLLDQTNTHKTMDQMIRLLGALDYQVDLKFKKVIQSSSLRPPDLMI